MFDEDQTKKMFMIISLVVILLWFWIAKTIVTYIIGAILPF